MRGKRQSAHKTTFSALVWAAEAVLVGWAVWCVVSSLIFFGSWVCVVWLG